MGQRQVAGREIAAAYVTTVRTRKKLEQATAAMSTAACIFAAVEETIEQLLAAAPCLSPAEQKAQAARCGCHGADDLCPCQNAPDATTRAARDPEMALLAPLFESTLNFLRLYKTQMLAAALALPGREPTHG